MKTFIPKPSPPFRAEHQTFSPRDGAAYPATTSPDRAGRPWFSGWEGKLRRVWFLVLWSSPLFTAYAVEIPPPGRNRTIVDIINSLTRFAVTLLAPLSVLMVLIAGFLYMTGGGNPEKIKTAHKVLLYALVGIAVVLLASSALVIIKEILGIQD